MHGFTIGSRDGERLQVRVRARAYPDATDFWDGNWLVTPVTARFGGFRADVPDALLRANEIEGFRDELRGLHEGLRGEARLSSMEEWLELLVTDTGPETLPVVGELRDRPGSPFRLGFAVDDQDRAQVRALLDDLDAVLAGFPVRGAP